jgi:hypothetical protein
MPAMSLARANSNILMGHLLLLNNERLRKKPEKIKKIKKVAKMENGNRN